MKKLSVFLMLNAALVGCGETDPFLAKSGSMSKTHIADIEARICRHDGNDCFLPIMAHNVEGGVQVASVDVLPGEAKYAGCGACHGANAGGGVGPKLSGKGIEYIVGRLLSYKAGETIGRQSNMMWGQAAGLSETDINDLAKYIETL